MARVAIVGAGAMGEAIIAGMVNAGHDPADIGIIEKRTERGDELIARYGVTKLANLAGVSTCFLVVKPNDLTATLESYRGELADDALVISMVAGKPTALIESLISQRVVRVMPNTPALVDEGMSALTAGEHCTEAGLATAEELLAAVGKTVIVPEKYQDAVTAISGSGPAYIFYVVEAMIEAGVVLGLPRATAHDLVVQTVVGAATMLRETGEHPTVLRENVTSPAGTTAAALRELDDHKVRAAFVTAMEAARDRSQQLASG